jgi:diguanylate cyclase (GGDEF)-like protein
MLWIPNSILLTGFFHFGLRRVGWVAALVLVAEIAADRPAFPLLQSALFGAVNLLEVTLAYALLKRWRFDTRFSSPRDLAVFVLCGPVAAALASACTAAAIYWWYSAGGIDFFEVLRVWWFSDATGLLLLTPLALSLWPPVPERDAEPNVLRWYDFLVLAATLLLLAAFGMSHQRVFHGWTLRSFILIPPVIYAAARFSTRVSAVVVVAFALVLLFITRNGQQPFGDVPVRETVISVQELLFVMSTMSLGLSALLSQHRASRRALELRIAERTAQLRTANAELAQLASTDALTGLLNRRALYALARREIDRAARHGRPLAAIVLDVDHFKTVNDRFGHEAGDVVLQAVASAAHDVLRTSDAVARYGGEEFVIIAPETDRPSAIGLAERLRTLIRDMPVTVGGKPLQVTASFGVAMYRGDDKVPDDLLRRADRALYDAKRGGRDRVVVDSAA